MNRTLVSVLFALTLATAGCGNDTSGVETVGTPTPEPATPTPAPTPEPEPMWVEMRGVVHVHSPFSHDACDGDGLPGGLPDALCLEDLRTSICGAGLRFVALTDHPSFMQDYPFEQVLLYDATAGDQLVTEAGKAIANQLACPGGARVLVTAGYEAQHTMPLGLKGHLPSESLYGGVNDAMPLADAQALADGLKAGGAVTALAHSEEPDLSAQRIADAGFEAMEWYNPHGNFKTVLGGDVIIGDPEAVVDLLEGMGSFLLGSESGAHADLLYLVLLPMWPEEGFEKWRTVQRQKHITGLLGSDVHQNVSIAPLCEGDPALEAACELLALAYPHWITNLLAGGQIVLTDGERIDGYDRLFRWLDNRVLALEPTPASIGAAIRQGRSFGVFRVFGEPEGFAYTGKFADGVDRAMGTDREGPATLRVMAPRPEALADGGPQFTAEEASLATIRVTLFRTDAAGTSVVRDEVMEPGTVLEQTVQAPGAYHVEVSITPHHLASSLGEESARAQTEYLWVITNPIRVR